MRIHDCRHVVATLLLKRGVNPKIVQERLGHKDIDILYRVYAHVLPCMQKEAADVVDFLNGNEVEVEQSRVRKES